MTTLLGVKADILTNGADTINANDEIATIASMCYVFFRLQNKPMNYCNKIRSARKMSEAVGIEIKEKSKKSNWERKQKVCEEETSSAFDIEKCTLAEKGSCEEMAEWHDPLDNPQIAVYTQNGNDKPANQVFGMTRHRAHQGIDLFALEGTTLYACLSGKVVSTRCKNIFLHLIISYQNKISSYTSAPLCCHLAMYKSVVNSC